MPDQSSITLSLSFQARSHAAERQRLLLLAVCYGVVACSAVARRAFGGAVMSTDAVFGPTLTILSVAITLTLLSRWHLTRLIRLGLGVPPWRVPAGIATDLAVPFGVLLVLHLYSPRGSYAALSAPALLLLPIVIMLSVLRLRPRLSFVTGLLAALGHWAHVASTFRQLEADQTHLPLLVTYGVLLAITGIAAAMLARSVRYYVLDAVAEAQSAERSQAALRSVERELEIASEIQMGLLPATPPTVAGLDVAGMARPAAQAGGDYYDWQPAADGRLLVAIADVTGHGIGPALVMAVCRAYSRATAIATREAEGFLERINQLILPDLPPGRFITMALALVDQQGGVDLLSAGHGPTLVYRREDASVEAFGGDGLPLGILAEQQYSPTTRLQLGQGDALILLTDGFIEHPSATGGMFGTERLKSAVTASGSGTANEIIQAIDAAVSRFAAGAAQNDDMTIVVIRRTQEA